MAIILLAQELQKKLKTGYKFGLCDASPMAGYDWLWSLFIIISKERLLPTFWAATDLKAGIGNYVAA